MSEETIGKIHQHHLGVMRMGRALLLRAHELGKLLAEAEDELGDDFDKWVETKLTLSPDVAHGYSYFGDEKIQPEQLTPDKPIDAKRVFELLGLLSAMHGDDDES